MNQSAPLVFIVGFLGSGKTTLIRDLLPLLETRGLDPFVIINDYANARVDASSLQNEGRTVEPINGNCICCDSVIELMNLLMEIPLTEERVVLIEANGTSDPTTLIEHLLVNPKLRDRFAPLLQIALVDLERWQKRHWHNELEQLQVQTASHLVFTRDDSTSKERFEEVRAHIQSFNSEAQRTELQDFAQELERLTKGAPSGAVKASDFGQEADHHQHHHDHDHVHDRHQLSHAFIGLEIVLPDPMSTSHLQTWLNALPKGVIRAKGVVRVIEEPDRWFQFQCVGERRDDATLHALPMEPIVSPCAVLIGVNLDEETIRSSLESSAANASPLSMPPSIAPAQ